MTNCNQFHSSDESCSNCLFINCFSIFSSLELDMNQDKHILQSEFLNTVSLFFGPWVYICKDNCVNALWTLTHFNQENYTCRFFVAHWCPIYFYRIGAHKNTIKALQLNRYGFVSKLMGVHHSRKWVWCYFQSRLIQSFHFQSKMLWCLSSLYGLVFDENHFSDRK